MYKVTMQDNKGKATTLCLAVYMELAYAIVDCLIVMGWKFNSYVEEDN